EMESGMASLKTEQPQGDQALYDLIERTLQREGRFPGDMTLFLGGMLISGTPISEQEFFARLAQLSSPTDQQLAEVGRETQEGHGGDGHYIHLKNARVFGVGSVQIIPLWRGQLAEVKGWYAGWAMATGEQHGVYAT
ncbi:MAG TPA: hypothetical protein VFS96_08085, partial [Nitrolancea sp.]|nr:hypothetical protein [Nitrolancea sp.]